jgi:hypothetical protein
VWASQRAYQCKNTAESDDVLTFFVTVREEGLHIQLWVSERHAARSLLEKDGVQLPELTWLSYTVHFFTSDERALLNIPADRDMAAYDSGNGYKMETLETAISAADPLSFKRFRQSMAHSPLAKRVLAIHRATTENDVTSKKKVKEDFSANQKPFNAGGKNNSGQPKTGREQKPPRKERTPASSSTNAAVDTPAALPRTADGALDKSRYDKWAEGSLRKRIWNRIAATPPECVRCGGPHPRKDCKETPLPWGNVATCGCKTLYSYGCNLSAALNSV